MKKYRRSAIENFILRSRATDFSKCSDDYLAEQLRMLRNMKKWIDMSTEETKASFTLIKGGKE